MTLRESFLALFEAIFHLPGSVIVEAVKGLTWNQGWGPVERNKKITFCVSLAFWAAIVHTWFMLASFAISHPWLALACLIILLKVLKE